MLNQDIQNLKNRTSELSDKVASFTSIIDTFKREFKDAINFKDKVHVQLKDFEALLSEYKGISETQINKMKVSIEGDLQAMRQINDETKQSNNQIKI